MSQLKVLLAVQNKSKTVGFKALEIALKDLVKSTPNDQALGAKIRKLV